MLKLQPQQEQVFKRVAAKAESMGLTRVGDPTWYWAYTYQVADNNKVTVGCNCDPNVLNSPVNIGLLVQLPSTGKYAKLEHKTYSLEEFEKLSIDDLAALSNHVQTKTNEIEELETRLNAMRKDLTKHVKKVLKA